MEKGPAVHIIAGVGLQTGDPMPLPQIGSKPLALRYIDSHQELRGTVWDRSVTHTTQSLVVLLTIVGPATSSSFTTKGKAQWYCIQCKAKG